MIFPFFPVLGISTTKDVIFGSLLLIVFVCICDMGLEKRNYRGWKLALFEVFFVLMGLFRNNAVYGVLFMIACTGAAEMLSVPCQQLARVYVYHGDEIPKEEKEELFRYVGEEYLARYKYYVSDPVKIGFDAAYFNRNRMDFVKLWWRIGKMFPGEYLLAPAYNSMGLWYMGGDSSCYMEYRQSPPFDEEHVVELRSLSPALKSCYGWFKDENIQKYFPVVSLLFYTSFYMWMVVICAAVLVERRQYVKLLSPCLLAGYGLTLILGPCITVRYMMGIMLCVPVLMAVAFRREEG